jgi:galactitol-specific phosphotransferase system IIB component
MACKQFAFACCGAGELTSFMEAEENRNVHKKHGIKNAKIQHGMIAEVPRYADSINVLDCCTTYTAKHEFVLDGLPFVIQVNEGEACVTDEPAEIWRNLKE